MVYLFQIEVCHQEAVKLATFINNQTPMIASDPFLSHLIAAHVSENIERNTATEERHTSIADNGVIELIPGGTYILSFTLFIFMF